jgi:2,4-diketo-3-deoxy-L-fuconate hydrolase
VKFFRHGAAGSEKAGVLDGNGVLRDLSPHLDDIDGSVLALGPDLGLGALDLEALEAVSPDERIGPCVAGVGKFICIGLNYSDHAKETGAEVPPEPVVFLKATTAICGANDDIERPRGSTKLDWEVELGLVIGRRAKYVSEAEAMDHLFGYCVINDVSEREFQMERSGTWDKGKGCDTFGPIGPWLVSRDEVADPTDLRMWLDVNGRRFQDGSTSTMIYKPAFLISYLSQFMTLLPGDVISTGTPPGVGMGQKPPLFLQAGDLVELGIEGLGRQRQKIVDAAW